MLLTETGQKQHANEMQHSRILRRLRSSLGQLSYRQHAENLVI